MHSRGVFIVLEGLDRSGKTTQAKYLKSYLSDVCGARALVLKFPERKTAIGKIINKLLQAESTIRNTDVDLEESARVLSLLFAANRWECALYMKELLNSGVSLIVDRYSYSGIVFGEINGVSPELLCLIEDGLPSPDLTIYLSIPAQLVSERKGFGDEKFEVLHIQKKAEANFKNMVQYTSQNHSWVTIDAGASPIEVHRRITKVLIHTGLDSGKITKPIRQLQFSTPDCSIKSTHDKKHASPKNTQKNTQHVDNTFQIGNTPVITHEQNQDIPHVALPCNATSICAMFLVGLAAYYFPKVLTWVVNDIFFFN